VVDDRGAAADAAGGRAGLRSVFARRSYRRLWAARTVSHRGDAFNTVALALLVVDRVGPGRVMVGADLVRVGLAVLPRRMRTEGIDVADARARFTALGRIRVGGRVSWQPAGS
jgi:hypothetical protein